MTTTDITAAKALGMYEIIFVTTGRNDRRVVRTVDTVGYGGYLFNESEAEIVAEDLNSCNRRIGYYSTRPYNIDA